MKIDGQHHCGDGRGRVHDARAEHHADGVQIVGGPRHQVAGAVADVKFGFESHEPGQQIVAQVVLDFARDSDQNPSRPEREKSFHKHQPNQQRAIDAQRVAAQRFVVSEERMENRARRPVSVESACGEPFRQSVMMPITS